MRAAALLRRTGPSVLSPIFALPGLDTLVWPNFDHGEASAGDPIVTLNPTRGRAFTQATSTKRPTWQQTNGVWVIRGDGTDDSVAQATGATVAQPNTIVALVKDTAAGTAQRQVVEGTNTGVRGSVIYRVATTTNVGVYAGAILNTGIAFGANYRLIALRAQSTTSKVWIDGGAATTGNAGGIGCEGLRLLDYAAGGFAWGGDIAAVVYGAGVAWDVTQLNVIRSLIQSELGTALGFTTTAFT